MLLTSRGNIYDRTMGRVVSERMVTRFRPGARPSRRRDTLVGEEPLEIRVDGTPLVVTMRTPGNDYELAAGFLVSEGVISKAGDFGGATYCRGGSGTEGRNEYNVLDILLGPEVEAPSPDLARNFYTTSSCGICGKASIDAIETSSAFDLSGAEVGIDLKDLLALPGRLRESQRVFDETGGLHAAAVFDGDSGEMLVSREDVGRHNAVDKVIGWTLMEGRLPLDNCVLQVSGRASFELVQKAKMAGIPIFAAVSAPSTLAVELAVAAEITLAGFVRGDSLVAYSRPDRIRVESPDGLPSDPEAEPARRVTVR
jgi:FdhD protein